jgi:hypothetical protein
VGVKSRRIVSLLLCCKHERQSLVEPCDYLQISTSNMSWKVVANLIMWWFENQMACLTSHVFENWMMRRFIKDPPSNPEIGRLRAIFLCPRKDGLGGRNGSQKPPDPRVAAHPSHCHVPARSGPPGSPGPPGPHCRVLARSGPPGPPGPVQ